MNSSLWNKILLVLRILLGVAMLYFGVSKIGAPDMMVNFVGSAGGKLGLTFLSVQTWFWIAVGGEILAGALLILGKQWAKYGAILTLIIMIFAGNAMGWDIAMRNWTLVTLASLVVLFYGNGSRSNDGSDCHDGICNVDTKISAMGDAVVGAGATMMGTVKDKIGDMASTNTLQTAKEKAGDMIDRAKDHLDTMVVTTQEWGSKTKDMADKVVDLVPGMDAVANKVDAVVDIVQDKADTVIDFAQDKIADAKEMVTDTSETIAKKVDVVVGEQGQDKG